MNEMQLAHPVSGEDKRLQASGSHIEPGGTVPPVLLEYLDIVRRRMWLILGILAVAVMLGLVATLLMRPTYTATSQIEVSRDQKNVTNVQGVESESLGRDLEFYQTQYTLLEARSLAERVMRRLRLQTSEDFWNAVGLDPEEIELGASGSKSRVGAVRENSGLREQAVIEALQDNLSVSPIRGSALIDISYTSYDPELSAQIANAWATEFIEQSISRKFDSTAEARSFLERRLSELRTRVEESERALVDYASRRNIVTLDSGSSDKEGNSGAQLRERTITAATLEALNQQLSEATGARLEAQAQAGRSGAAQTNNTLARLREQRVASGAELAELLVRFEEGYPQVQAVQRRVNELDQAIENEERRIRSEAREALQAATARESALRSRVESLSRDVLGQRRDAIQYNTFQREADTNRQLYDSLLQRYKEIGVAGVSASNIAVIDGAEVPREPSSPNLILNLFVALLAGIGGALVLVFILEQRREGITDPTKVANLIGIPLLGSIPKAEADEDVIDLIGDPKSDVSEAYLAVRSSLAFSTQHGVPRSMMLVSAQPAEGKSMSSIALASVLARVEKRVLLIDADLRNPSAHSYLNKPRDFGLSNYLVGGDDIDELIQQVGPKMDLLAAGPSVPSAAELLSSDRLAKLIELMEGRYDHVIVDSAPIIGLADAQLVSQAVESVIFVAEAGRVSVRGINSALSRLWSVGAPLVGAILTKLDQKTSAYGYGYSYSYNYRSKNERDNAAE